MYTARGLVNKEKYVVEYAPLVKRVAHHMMAKLPPTVAVEDIIQAGMIGLLDAVNRFEESQGAQFEAYAVQRIRGAILDGLREGDWLPRSLRRNMRRIEAAISSLQQKYGRQPTEGEIAALLEVSLIEYQQMLADARGYQLISIEDFGDGDDEEGFLDRHCISPNANPLDTLIDRNLREILVDAIEQLPERERTLMGLYYEQELNLREIGEILGVSESRVCQLHSQAIARLRSQLKDRC